MRYEYEISKLPPYCLLNEPLLSFNPEDSQLDENPLRGIARYGAYSSATFSKYTPALRIATMAPKSKWGNLSELVTTLRSPQTPRDRKDYVPPFDGFEKVFSVPLVAAPPGAHIKWSEDLCSNGVEDPPHVKLMQIIRMGFERLTMVRDQFDVVLVYFPDSWKSAFRAPFFNAHDSLKALGANHGIPTQVLNDRTFTFDFKASLAWRLSIALYVKAGGIPWRLAPLSGVSENTAYIGLAYSLRKDEKSVAHFVTCCSQVFDADGGGMQFVAFEARDPVKDIDDAKRNPFLSRSDMRAVLTRSICLYQSRNGGNLPRRIVVHKTTSFKNVEIEGAMDALAGIPEVECIEIGSKPRWRAVWLKQARNNMQRSSPDMFPVPRGTVLQVTGTSALVWVAGNAPKASLGSNYYQGSKSIPRPISITRYMGKGPLEITALEALALTKMDWNNDALYDPVPVTIRYSQILARTIANVPSLPGRAYAYRLFM